MVGWGREKGVGVHDERHAPTRPRDVEGGDRRNKEVAESSGNLHLKFFLTCPQPFAPNLSCIVNKTLWPGSERLGRAQG